MQIDPGGPSNDVLSATRRSEDAAAVDNKIDSCRRVNQAAAVAVKDKGLAVELDAPLGTVKAQLHRARELMFEMVKNKRDHI